MNADNSYEYFSSLREKLKEDDIFYHKVSSLCLLIVKGTSDEIKKNAKNQLDDFLGSNLDVIPVISENITSIYLANISKAEDLWVLSLASHYVAFSDGAGLVHIVSTN